MRQIDLNIQGSRVSVGPGDPCVAGEGNASCLALRFGPDWDGLAKTAQFWDAHGQNPVTCLIGEDMGEQEEGGRVYRLPIPPEPLAQAGTCTLVLEGAKDAVRMRTLPVELEVQDAPWSVQAQPPTDPTPTLAQQLQSQIDALAGRDSANFANALVGVQQGTAVRVDDASPLAREVSVAVTGVDDPAGIEVEVYGRNLFDATGAKSSGQAVLSQQQPGQLTVTQNTSSYYISANFAIPEELTGEHITARAYAKPSGGNQCGLRVQWLNKGAAKGRYIIGGLPAGQEGWITLSGVVPEPPEEGCTLSLMFYSNTEGTVETGGCEVGYSNIQLELGDTATDYAPYRPPTVCTTDENGCCGVAAQGDTTLLTQTTGAILTCTYPRDTNRAYDRLVQAIISMGGNV